jgi:hypothetical protein
MNLRMVGDGSVELMPLAALEYFGFLVLFACVL